MQVVRITRGRIKPGAWEDFERALKGALRGVGSVKGLVSRSLIRSVDDPDEGYALSIWESLEDLMQYEQSALAETVTPLIQSFFTGDYRADHCEIRYWNKAPETLGTD